jgi:hypothetical protein
VKESALALVFPLFIALLVPLRFGLARSFDARQLESLDSDVDEAEIVGEAAG